MRSNLERFQMTKLRPFQEKVQRQYLSMNVRTRICTYLIVAYTLHSHLFGPFVNKHMKQSHSSRVTWRRCYRRHTISSMPGKLAACWGRLEEHGAADDTWERQGNRKGHRPPTGFCSRAHRNTNLTGSTGAVQTRMAATVHPYTLITASQPQMTIISSFLFCFFNGLDAVPNQLNHQTQFNSGIKWPNLRKSNEGLWKTKDMDFLRLLWTFWWTRLKMESSNKSRQSIWALSLFRDLSSSKPGLLTGGKNSNTEKTISL